MEHLDAKTVGRQLKETRLLAGLSQSQVADRMSAFGISWHQVTVGKIERGERRLEWSEGLAFSSAVGPIGPDAPGAAQMIRDAAAYRRILRVIGENEAVAE